MVIGRLVQVIIRFDFNVIRLSSRQPRGVPTFAVLVVVILTSRFRSSPSLVSCLLRDSASAASVYSSPDSRVLDEAVILNMYVTA